MGMSSCFSSSQKRTQLKIGREINYLTETKEVFEKKSSFFVLSASKYNNNKSKIIVDIIKAGISNIRLAFEKRYLYLSLLDKLILNNVAFLQYSYQNDLLSYILLISGDLDKQKCFDCSENDGSVGLLYNFSISCIKGWYEKYSLVNDESVGMLRDFMLSQFSNSSENIGSSLYDEADVIESNTLNIIQRDAPLPENSSTSPNSKADFKLELNIPNSASLGVPNPVCDDCYSDTNKKEAFTDNLNSPCDYTTDQCNILDDKFIGYDRSDVKGNIDANLSISEPKQISIGFDGSSLNEMKTVEMKYNLLKEKYLFLVQKNEYLQSKLDYHEDFNVIARNKQTCIQDNNFQLLGNTSSITELSDGFLKNFNNLIIHNDWILFEDNVIQLGVKFQISGSSGYFDLYFGNKLPTRLEDFALSFSFSNVYPNALSIKQHSEVGHPKYVIGKQQLCLNFKVECSDVYTGVPSVNIQFLFADNTPREIMLPFPLVVSKFSYEKDSYPIEFLPDLWHSEAFLMSQASTQTTVNSTVRNISDIVNMCKLNDTFRLFVENEDNGEVDKRIYLQGDVLNSDVIVQVNESTPHSFIFRVRSDSGILSNSILSIILFQIKNSSF
ncbi:adaptin AP complex subunit alpha [Cryptosporidium canis]|uniref:Adaptin AP complex subunit alpha n=1 Tax=Cryptosporidium canis TaxID=195482 RepID=A0ABQ8PB28_9CRYT|nr:adaptin AP complex subunit alpha [Cryptosporidium canis]KAJ1615105.1 adaptin AP complex subunit alpha [Cryptosporidium canis]